MVLPSTTCPESVVPKPRWGVVLLAHGAPERIDDIPEFLLNVRGGRKLPEDAVRAITERYARIGGSPLLKLTMLQAQALSKALNALNGPVALPGRIPVTVGMRNWRPFISEALQSLSSAGVTCVVAICLAPQNSSTSIGLYRKSLSEAVANLRSPIEVNFVESWHKHPGLIAAFAEKLKQAFTLAGPETGRALPVVFTAHSVPERTIEAGDPYQTEVYETARLVAESVNLKNWQVAFQSQGMTGDAWIGPTVESVIDRLAEEGNRDVLISPVGFVSDHVEILYDIDVVFRNYARRKGLQLCRAESLNDSPLFISGLATLVKDHIGGGIRKP
jgi:protoporphyrin/coproporphyrin ferrochelatase